MSFAIRFAGKGSGPCWTSWKWQNSSYQGYSWRGDMNIILDMYHRNTDYIKYIKYPLTNNNRQNTLIAKHYADLVI